MHHFPGYATLRKDRVRGGSGLLTLVSKSIPFTHTTARTLASLQVDNTRELQSLTLRVGKTDLQLCNVYLPPYSSCSLRYVHDLSLLESLQNTLILGDFNAHDSAWFSAHAEDTRGE